MYYDRLIKLQLKASSKGKVERNFRTLRSRWLSTLDASKIHSLEQFNEMLKEYIDTHNQTVHSGINERPIDRYLRTKSYIRIPKSREWLEEAFYNRDERHARKDSVVIIDKTEYDVPPQFADKWVEVRFNPSKMEDAYILYDGEKFPIVKTDRAKNSTSRRNSKQLTIHYHVDDESEAV